MTPKKRRQLTSYSAIKKYMIGVKYRWTWELNFIQYGRFLKIDIEKCFNPQNAYGGRKITRTIFLYSIKGVTKKEIVDT